MSFHKKKIKKKKKSKKYKIDDIIFHFFSIIMRQTKNHAALLHTQNLGLFGFGGQNADSEIVAFIVKSVRTPYHSLSSGVENVPRKH